MDLTTITMPKDEAKAKFEEYRASVRRRHDREDEQIMRGFRALARGQQVIDIAATVRKGGAKLLPGRYREVFVPALAVMRADQPWCYVRTTTEGRVEYHHQGSPKANERRNYIKLPANTLSWPAEGHQPAVSWWNVKAMVPPVPPALRPADKLGNYHVLWEAEWRREPPRDPALLKHIGGDLYAVLAVWDLTELERCVLAGRFGA